MNLFTSFICIIFAVISVISSANANDVAPPRLAPLLAPRASPRGVVDCTSLMYDMADCISFLTVGSKATNPDPECCSQLVKVLKTDAGCVCEALKTTANLGFDIDMQRVAALPSACNTKAPSIDSCYMSDAPRSTSPVTAPTVSPATNPVMAPTISPATSPVMAHTISPATSPVMAPTISLATSPVMAPTISPATSPVTAPTISPATSPVTARTISPVTAPANSPQTTSKFPNSPSPVPIEAPNSHAPVPQASLVSAKSPTPVPNISPMSSKSPAPVPSTKQGVSTHHAPAPTPTANAYAVASSPGCLFSMLVASFLYMLA